MTHAKDRTLVLHIGLHKTATTYVQSVLGARRDDLRRAGVLYPLAGSGSPAQRADEASNTRAGAQSGHALFTTPETIKGSVAELLDELSDSVSTVLLSSEDFSLGLMTPQEYLSRFSAFGRVEVVLVLRRQDIWVESYYKQMVDQHRNFETRSFEQYLAQRGRRLLDFHARFSAWRDLVGPDSFHVLSYDDLAGAGDAICRRLGEIAGVGGRVLEGPFSVEVPRYESVRGIDTVGLRVLNTYRLEDRSLRVATARSIYDSAPDGEIELLTPVVREAIRDACVATNQRIETEWFREPVPGLCFGTDVATPTGSPPSTRALLDYLDRVVALCEAARKSDAEKSTA